MDKPKLLDLYSGAGGAAYGYKLAGFDVTGVDIRPQPRYAGDRFIQADALDYVAQYGWMYDAIHASPPCQRYSSITKTAKSQHKHSDYIPQTRYLLETIGLPYVIENVPGARKYLHNPFMLCGTMFNLMVVRHRYFETNISQDWLLPPCCHDLRVAKHGRPAIEGEEFAAVTGHFSGIKYARKSMGISWTMNQKELSQAIPPAYTYFIGLQLMLAIEYGQQRRPEEDEK